MAIRNEKSIGHRAYSWEWVTNRPFRWWLRLYGTNWQDVLDIKLHQGNGVILTASGKVVLWCYIQQLGAVTWPRERGAGRQTDRHNYETIELNHVTNITLTPDMLSETPSVSFLDKYTQTWTCVSTEKGKVQCHFLTGSSGPPHLSAVVENMCHIYVYNTASFYSVPLHSWERELNGWADYQGGRDSDLFPCSEAKLWHTQHYSVGENPDSIHGLLSSFSFSRTLLGSVSLYLVTALAVNGDTSFIKGSWKRNESVVMKYLAILILLSACWSPHSSDTRHCQTAHLWRSRVAEFLCCTWNHVQTSNGFFLWMEPVIMCDKKTSSPTDCIRPTRNGSFRKALNIIVT